LDTLSVTGSIAVQTVEDLITPDPGDVTLVNATAVDLAASNVGGHLQVTATTGDVIDSGLVTVSGNASFTTAAAGRDINLDTLAVTGSIAVNTVEDLITPDTGDATLINATA